MNIVDNPFRTTDQSSFIPLIYIVGNSHSGSTLLSFLLSAHPDIINLGEIKAPTWLHERQCSCGLPAKNCGFYENIFDKMNSIKNEVLPNIKPGSGANKAWNPTVSLSDQDIRHMRTLYSILSERAYTLYPDIKFIVDSSKSIWMLNAWLQALGPANIKVMWIHRPLKPSISSFIKRGNSFLKSVITVKANDRVSRNFLSKADVESIHVNYASFYHHYATEAGKISDFLGVDIPLHFKNHRNHHVISGNKATRSQFAEEFKGFTKDEEWKTVLTPFQKQILSWLEKR